MTADFTITLPLPPSLNAAYSPDRRTGGLRRSEDYNNWLQTAGVFWRRSFPEGTQKLLTGRIRAQYVLWLNDFVTRDVGNFEKIIADYLQGKFYVNDSQIDELHVLRRIDRTSKRNLIHCYITEIPDDRFVDMFNQKGT